MDALIETGKPAPELSLQDLYGRSLRLHRMDARSCAVSNPPGAHPGLLV